MELIDGRKISNEKKIEIKEEIHKIKQKINKVPGLATILVGHDPASQIYVESKIKACEYVGIKSFHYNLSANSSLSDIVELIKKLNTSSEIDGILLQLPIPDNKNAQKCINAIDPLKDVDGLHPFNSGLVNLSKSWDEIVENNILVPCTPLGIINLLHASSVTIDGKNVVVIGRSNLVGKPLSMLLLANNATVIMAHSKTEKLKELCRSSDIVIVAIGKSRFVGREFLRNGMVVVDVGVNRTSKGLCGDVDFDMVKDMDVKITPVPGGVGPMTITMLLENTLKAFLNNRNSINLFKN